MLLKGPATVVAEPGGECASCAGDERLATAGTGDVLAGIIGALLASGMPAVRAAAAAGAWIHATAASLAPAAGLVAERRGGSDSPSDRAAAVHDDASERAQRVSVRRATPLSGDRR